MKTSPITRCWRVSSSEGQHLQLEPASAEVLRRSSCPSISCSFAASAERPNCQPRRCARSLTEAGFENVSTYINSGNAVVRKQPAGRRLSRQVAGSAAQHSTSRRPFTLPTHSGVGSADRTITHFADAVSSRRNFLHAALLEATRAKNIDAIRRFALDGDRLAVVGKVAYIHTPNGFGKSKMGAKFDKGIGVENTARNWNTVLKLRDWQKS